jgi:hypothetical protein
VPSLDSDTAMLIAAWLGVIALVMFLIWDTKMHCKGCTCPPPPPKDRLSL